MCKDDKIAIERLFLLATLRTELVCSKPHMFACICQDSRQSSQVPAISLPHRSCGSRSGTSEALLISDV